MSYLTSVANRQGALLLVVKGKPVFTFLARFSNRAPSLFEALKFIRE